MTTKTAGHRITGHLALTFEAQEGIDVGQPCHVIGDYEVEIADGTRPVIGRCSVPNKKRNSSVSGTSVGNDKVPGDVTVEASGFSVDYTDQTGEPFDAGVAVGWGSDGKLHPMVANAGPVNEVQTVTEGGSGLVSFTLTYAGQTTTSLAAASTAAQVQAALEALSNINVGDVAVTGSTSGPFSVTFKGQFAGENVAAMTATPTGGTGTVTIATATAGAGITLAPYGVSLTGIELAGEAADILVG